jgi:hypothetical protein
MTTSLILTNNQTALARLVAVARQTQTITLLKFVKGKWYNGDAEVAADREFIAHVDQLAHGFIKFGGGKVIEQRIGLVADASFVPPERAALGDTDESKWEIGPDGKPRDPCVFQYLLPLEDGDTGELFTFVTNSHGGNGAIGKLTAVYVNNMHRGQPRVQLVNGWYKHKTFGRVETPEFKVSGWTGAPANHEPPPRDGPSYDMDDQSF